MSINAQMSANLASLKHTLNLSLLKSAQSTQAAMATTMLEDMKQTNAQIQKAAPHPTAGKHIDIQA